jgi:hypothetical protein
MNKKTSKIVDKVEAYLRNSASLPLNKRPTPKEIELHITEQIIKKSLVSELFSIEVIPIDDSYSLMPRNNYTLVIMGALPMFCLECGRLLGLVQTKGMKENSYMDCSHKFEEPCIKSKCLE